MIITNQLIGEIDRNLSWNIQKQPAFSTPNNILEHFQAITMNRKQRNTIAAFIQAFGKAFDIVYKSQNSLDLCPCIE